MSQNKRTVDQCMDGFPRGDHAQILSCLTDDVEWDIPGMLHLSGKDAFDQEMDNEENDVVVAEGSVQARRRDGHILNLKFSDVCVIQAGTIKRVTSYLSDLKHSNRG